MQKEKSTITKESPRVVQFPVELRDWFAGQYISSGMANSPMDAARAYEIADAMLAECARTEKK